MVAMAAYRKLKAYVQRAHGKVSSTSLLYCALIVLALHLWPSVTLGDSGKTQVLLLFSNESLMPAYNPFVDSFRATVAADMPGQLVLFTEYLDAIRFPEAKQQGAMFEFLREKYRTTHIDLVVAFGPQSL